MTNDDETSPELAPASDQYELKRREVWSMLVELGVQERHFNELESRYRTLASTWLLATLAGVGFVASNSHVAIPVPRLIVMALLAFAGAGGILLLWNLDLMVYHRLLDSCFLAGVLFEARLDWLPKLRTEMMRSAPKSGGVLRRIIYFYIGSAGLLIATSATCAIGWAHAHIGWCAWLLSIPAIALIVGVGYELRRRSLTKSAGWERVETLGLIDT